MIFLLSIFIVLSVPSSKGERCFDVKEPGLTWIQFCEQVLNRICYEDLGSEPYCGECRTGYTDIGSAVCAEDACKYRKDSEKTWRDFCEEIPNKRCIVNVHQEPVCSCKPGFGPNTAGMCVERSCQEWNEDTGMTFVEYCKHVNNRICQIDTTGNPNCGDCKPGFRELNGKCEALTCQDISSFGLKWTDLCKQELNKVCVVNSQGPTCVCRTGFKEESTGNCIEISCSDIKENNLTWTTVCQNENRVCVHVSNNDPKCGGCMNGFKESLTGNCIGQKCSDQMDWSITWNEFCVRSENMRCDESSDDVPTCVCNDGFVLNQDKRCVLMRSTMQAFTTDSEGLCTDLVEPAYGTLAGLCSGALPGDKCFFYCHKGFWLDGASLLTCLPQGIWDLPTPSCREVEERCVDLASPDHGFTSGRCVNSAPGDLCAFACLQGFQLDGGPVLICRPGGTWDGDIPSCIPTIKCSDTLEGTNDTWNMLCARGKDMVCKENPSDGPECDCRKGFKRNEIGTCVVMGCDDFVDESDVKEIENKEGLDSKLKTWSDHCAEVENKKCNVDKEFGPKCV